MGPTRWSRYPGRGSPLGAIVTLICIALITVLVGVLSPPVESLVGLAEAIDGDTIRIGSTRIRLVGLDAVELDQTCRRDGNDWACGREARAFAVKLTRTGETRCTRAGRDQYRRVLAHCSISGTDFGDAIVRAGWATAELEYALPLADARLNRRGIWAGTFDDPAEWRRSRGDAGSNLWTWLLSLFRP